MCGIAGWVGAGAGQAEDRVRAMLGTLARRGPDGEGLETIPLGVLGHRRLAIFDLSDSGRQPMSTPDGELWVVFNGAIYNFPDLRRELEAHGHHFRSRTDTEVLLLGYREWGLDGLLLRLRGMFAFALADVGRRRLVLVRDRLGVKPLLYAEPAPGQLAFASTADALARAGLGGDVNAEALAAVLQVGYVPDTLSIREGIRKLPPGHLLEWAPDEPPRVRQYWESPTVPADSPLTFAAAVDEAEQGLLEAVRLRLAADVPVGCLLSGGVDSSLVAWAASQHQQDVRVFTVSTPGDPADEAPVARQTATLLGLRHEVVTMDTDPAEALNDLVSAFDEPFPCSSALGLLQVSKAIRPHATVLLTGDGGDEAFLGYPEHLSVLRAQQLARFVPRVAERVVAPALALATRREAVVARRALRMFDYAARGLQGVIAAQRERWSAHWDLVAGAGMRDQPGFPAASRGGTTPDRLLADYIVHQRSTVFLGEYLPKVDRATMYHGLESRAPFLDQELWSAAARMPHTLRLQGGRTKAVLRALAARRVGTQVSSARKRGFTIPVERWLPTRWAPMLDQLEQEPMLVQEGWLDRAGLAAMVRQARRSGTAPTFLWHVVVAEAWLRRLHSGAVGESRTH